MKIHEYQAKEILRRFGVATPRGVACFTLDEALEAGRQLGGPVWVVKAQIHAGGRGKGGGVKVARTPDELKQHAQAILGMRLVTHQTGPEGRIVRRLLVEEGADIRAELYIGMVVDRSSQRVVLMASSEGGMDIEEVAASAPRQDPQGVHRPHGRADAGSGHRRCPQDRHPGRGAASGGRAVGWFVPQPSRRPMLRWPRSTR